MAKDFSARRLRILHVTKWYPNRDDIQNGVFVQKQIQATTAFAEVKVLAWLPGGVKTETRESHENGLAVTRTWFKKRTPASAKRHAFADYIHSHYNNRNLPDLLHLHVFSPDLLVAVLWAKKKKIPVVITEHWSGYMRGVFDQLPRWRKWAYRRLAKVNRVLPVSQYLKENMQQSGIEGNFTVVPNVVETDFLAAPKLPGFAFVMVSDLVDEIKNISGVILAFNNAYAKNQSLSLHIIGGGPDEEALRAIAANSAAAEAITFLGRQANQRVKALLSQYHCLIVNSRVETFGVVVLEAHAAGLPVIATRCGGPEEWLEELDIAVAIDNADELQKAMLVMSKRGEQAYAFSKYLSCLPNEVGAMLNQIYLQVIEENQLKNMKRRSRTNKLKPS